MKEYSLRVRSPLGQYAPLELKSAARLNDLVF